VQVKDVGFVTETDPHAEPPKLTVAPDTKPVPVIVTFVPPVIGPVFCQILVTVGAGEKVKEEVGSAACPSVFVTPTV
jgi:hypothetical protein